MKNQGRLIAGVVLILVFAMSARMPLDSDLWWHLRAGQASWESGRPLLTDIFSYTRYGEHWINHSWLSQLILYGIYRLGGFPALAGFIAGLATILMALVYAQMEGYPILRAFTIILASAVAAPVWSPRPQMISLVMFGLLAYLLYRFKWRKQGSLWGIIPLIILWSNLHGGYVLGLGLIGIIMLGEVANHLLGYEGPEIVPWKGIGKLAMMLVAGAAVALINPNGFAMWLIPFRTVGVNVLQKFIAEWRSPDFHQLYQQPFLWLLFATLSAAGLSRRRLDGSDLFSLGAFAYLAFLARRNYGPFAVIAAPILTRHLDALLADQSPRIKGFLDRFKRDLGISSQNGRRYNLPDRSRYALNALVLIVLSGAAFAKLTLVSAPSLLAKFEEKQYPVAAAQWIEENRPEGNLFNDYNWGGFLIWTLRDYPVFVDGRTDLFNDELLEEYLQAAAGEAGWRETLRRYNANLILIESGAGLDRALKQSESWEEDYRDDLAVIYVRKLDR